MAEFKTLFDQGVDYETFVSQGSDDEIAALRRDQAKTERPDFLSPSLEQQIQALSGRFSLLVAAEMWCPDCQRNLPALQALCQRYPEMQLRVVPRDSASTLFQAQFGVERVKIPFVAVLDDAWHPLGAFIERPQAVINGDEAVLASYKRGERLADTVADIVTLARPA